MTTSPSSVTRAAGRLLLAVTLVLGLSGGVATTSAAPAQAAGVSATVGIRALAFAASKKGAPYQYGAVGPSPSDCSGFTRWAYARAGRTLPRTVAQQYAAT